MTTARPDTPTALHDVAEHSARPIAHFTTANTWLNDPNGLLYYKGLYHLYFQNNPHGATWGNISWGHATSTDLLSWTEHPVAIAATADEMAFSGSAVADVRNTAGFASAGQAALVAIYTRALTSAAGNGVGSQAQALAYSLDEGTTWERYGGNPVLDIGSAEFRDPKVFWHGDDNGHWVMVAVEAADHRVVIYTSDNLLNWTRRSHFGPAHATGGVWECPDLFPLTVVGTDVTRWVLVVSLNPGSIAGGSGTQYFIGDFDGATFTPERLSVSRELSSFDWLDFGRDYYAAVSFNEAPDGRRLMIGWASNWQYANETPTYPWRSAMSLVREMRLVRCADGRLRVTQTPVLPSGPSAVSIFDVRVTSEPGTRTEVLLSSDDGGSLVVLTVDGDARTVACDRTRSGNVDFHPTFASVDCAPILTCSPHVDLQIVVDATVLEVYIDDGLTTLTQQVFPHAPLTTLRVESCEGSFRK